MGLDCSHDAFHGAYSAFNRFRQIVAKAMGGSFPPHDDKAFDQGAWYWGDGYGPESHPGLFVFMLHSDCDGEITPQECVLVADDLEKLLPSIKSLDAAAGGYVAVTQGFIAGCRAAASAGEPLGFC